MHRGTHRAPSKGHSKILITMLVVGMIVALLAPAAMAAKPDKFDSDGNVIHFVGDTGFDSWGYNYNARMFSGGYCDAYENADWCQPYKDINLIMKWNDAWLSNLDRDLDGHLDRHWGFGGYIGSGAWLTNHQKGEYLGESGETCKWTYFVKIVAAPADAYKDGGYWYTADGVEIGQVIWGSFATTEKVEHDTCTGVNGAQYVSPFSAGFGVYAP